jgi:hypothetical protein
MASITQPSDFKVDILIPNTDQNYVASALQGYIDKYEPIYLKTLLGPDLYALYIAGLAEVPVPAKWTALKAQISYAPANFIYWYWMTSKQTQSVGIGEQQSKAANAEMTSPRLKMVAAWDEMVGMSFDTVRFITDNTADYGDYYLPNFFSWNWLCQWDRPNIFYKTQEFDF